MSDRTATWKAMIAALAAIAALLAPARSVALVDPCDVFLGGDWIGVLDPNDFLACYGEESDIKGPPPFTEDYVAASNRDGEDLYHLFGATTCNPDGFIGGAVSVLPVGGGPEMLVPVIGRFRSRLSATRSFVHDEGLVDTASLSQSFALKGLLRDGSQKTSLRAKGSNKTRLSGGDVKSTDKLVSPDLFEAILIERMQWDVLGCLFVTGGDPACFDIILKYSLLNCAFSQFFLSGADAEFKKPDDYRSLTSTGYFNYPGGTFFGGMGSVKNSFYDSERDRLGKNSTGLRIGKLWTRSTAIGFMSLEQYLLIMASIFPCFYDDELMGDYFIHGSLGFSAPGSTSLYRDRSLSHSH